MNLPYYQRVLLFHIHTSSNSLKYANNNIHGRSSYVVVARLYDTRNHDWSLFLIKKAQTSYRDARKISIAISSDNIDEVISQSIEVSQEHEEA